MNVTKTLTLTKAQIDDLKKQYKNKQVSNNNPYIDAQFKTEDCIITIYTSQKVVFQGEEAESIASIYLPSLKVQAGSDEVGTGDYFGPVVVVACAITEDILDKLKEIPLLDSKVLDDEMIVKIAQQVKSFVPYSVLVVDNVTYNRIHQKHNLNAIKALLHNQAYVHLEKKVKIPDLAVVDQFTPETSYYRYLKDEKLIYKHLHFETKAESKYPAVALASILARAKFLEVMKKMNDHYDFEFPFGSGAQVDNKAKEFVEKYGFDKLNEVAKVHFKNTERIQKK